MQTSRCVAGIDVHKKMLAVVVGRTREQSLQLERGKFGTTTEHLELLSDWLQARGVEEVVMESTGQYHLNYSRGSALAANLRRSFDLPSMMLQAMS